MPAPRVLVVDDDPAVAEALRRGLAAEGYEIETAADGEAGLRSLEERRPDIVVLDLLMPVMGGIEMCRRLRQRGHEFPVLMLTAKDGITDQVIGLDAGADDYLVKPFTFAVLTARLRALLRRREPRAADLIRYEDLALDTGSHVARRARREIHLTTTEYRLLHELLRRAEQVVSKEELTQLVWDYDFGGNYNVVEVYVSHLRQKLEERGERRLIHTLRGSGYILRATAP